MTTGNSDMTEIVKPRKKGGGRPRIEVPSPVDVHVGKKVKERRLILGMSQDKLAKELELTFQQVQKYERGTNRISASRLHDLSRILGSSISSFFEGMTPERGLSDNAQEPFAANPLEKRETLELIRAYYRIQDSTVRKRIFEMVKAVASTAHEDVTN